MGNLNFNISSDQEIGSRGYKYRDFDIRFHLSPAQKNYDALSDIDSIRQGLSNIFNWRQGERIILPEFGNKLHFYLYEPLTDITIGNVKRDIELMISQWEPRVDILNIDVETDPEQNQMDIQVIYNVPTLSDDIVEFSTIINNN
jgi:phage baseplate assembly protein W